MRSRRLAVCVSRLAAGGTQRAAAGAGPGRCPSGRRALSAAAAAPERKKAEPGPAAAADRMDEPLVWPGAEAADADALAKRGNDWMNLAAIVFERQPVLMKELPEWEREHRAYQDINKDVMYQRELYVSPRIREVEALAKTDGSARAAPEEDAPNTRSTRELVPMTPATRRSSARALDDRLYLIVKARDPLEPKRLVWQFPTVRYRSEKPAKEEGAPAIPMSMRSTVIDGVISYFSDQVSAYPVGYSPVAHVRAQAIHSTT